jgi:hypothetical protein
MAGCWFDRKYPLRLDGLPQTFAREVNHPLGSAVNLVFLARTGQADQQPSADIHGECGGGKYRLDTARGKSRMWSMVGIDLGIVRVADEWLAKPIAAQNPSQIRRD